MLMTPSMLDGSDAHWLMYSDWLEERGQEDRAHEIRSEIESLYLQCWSYEFRSLIVGVGGVGVGGVVGGVGRVVGGVGVGGVVGGAVGGVGVGVGRVVGGVGRVVGGGGVGVGVGRVVGGVGRVVGGVG